MRVKKPGDIAREHHPVHPVLYGLSAEVALLLSTALALMCLKTVIHIVS
jgi:hypothetical protein